MALQAGRLFGNYRVVRPIGEGAFGEVYLAENPLIERRVAIKVLRPMLAQDAELVRRFFNEARAASAIRHPSIIEVFDAGETPEGFPYILMEFLEGTSLKKRLVEVGKLSVEQALEIASQAGSALAATHAIGIVHRDLKPENLFLVPDRNAPGGERVKILDFGIAKVKHLGGGTGSFRTESGLIMGSPTYMSPEQCKDSADVDLRADVYSLATIVYEMMAGRPPYTAASGVELLLMHLTDAPRPLRELAPHVPEHVEDAVMRALHRERSERFDGVPGFLGALTQEAGVGPTGTLPGGYGRPAGPRSVRRAERAGASPGPSTFSPASTEVGSESGSQTQKSRPPFVRRLGLALGGLFVMAFVLLWLLPRGHDTRAPVAGRATALPPVPLEPARLPSANAASVVVGHAADSGAKPGAASAAPRIESKQTMTQRAAPMIVKRSRTMLRRGHDTTTSATKSDQEDIAGF